MSGGDIPCRANELQNASESQKYSHTDNQAIQPLEILVIFFGCLLS